MKYRIFAALHSELNSGWIWLGSPALPSRCVVKITNPNNGRSVYCEALQIDNNFLGVYNRDDRCRITDKESALVINAWYRKRLGDFPTQSDQDLQIKPAKNLCGRIQVGRQHPQVVVRLANFLAMVSVTLAIISVGLGIWGLMRDCTKPLPPIGQAEPTISRPLAPSK